MAKNCQFCYTTINTHKGIAICPSCNTLVHVDCATNAALKCPTPNCLGTLIVHPNKVEMTVSGSDANEVEFVARRLLNEARHGKPDQEKKIKILFLTANPGDSTRLRLDSEIRAIDLALRQVEFRDRFDIRQQGAVRISDLQAHFLRHSPDIIHFSGHTNENNEIIFEDNSGNSVPISERILGRLFRTLQGKIRCVVLNACYSIIQANAIAQYVDCVVGMSAAISDIAAISFSASFYQALGYGSDIQTAFDLACLQIDMENLNEYDVPSLIAIRANSNSIKLW